MTCKRCHRRAKYRGLCSLHFEAVGHHGFVDAQPTRDRIAVLRSRGYSLRSLSERTGVTVPTLLCRYDKVQRATEAAVMAVPIPAIGGSGHVNSIGSRRRIQALVAIGWPQRQIAARVGMDCRAVSRIVRTRKRVTGDTAAVIAGIYDLMWAQPGPSVAARRQAAREGWAPPLGWDDESIDDPAAVPNVGCDTPVTFAERYIELRELGERSEEVIAGRLWNPVGKRFGISTESVKTQCNRHGLERVS